MSEADGCPGDFDLGILIGHSGGHILDSVRKDSHQIPDGKWVIR